MIRDHQALVIEEFNGWWQRGGVDSCPLDHFSDCNNISFIESGFETRSGLQTLIAQSNVLRIYDYKTQTTEGILILNVNGNIYHALLDGSNTVYGPILTIVGMTDFGFQSFDGRAYITPFTTYTDTRGQKYQKGLQNQFLYVYKGDGTNARKAAGFPPTSATVATDQNFHSYNSDVTGLIDKGIHLVTVQFVGGAGALAIGVFPVVYAPGGQEIQVEGIPIGPIGTTARNIGLTKSIDPKDFTGNQASYTYYQALNIPDNTTVSALLSVPDTALVAAMALGVIPTVTGIKAVGSQNDGFSDNGFHILAVVYETDTGYLTSLGPEVFATYTSTNVKKGISVTNIPVSPDSFVVKRHLVATIALQNYNGDQTGYQFFFIPNGTLNDNIATSLDVSFYDADLLDDASHLIDNFSEIPAGVALTSYHGRMVLTTSFNDISLARLSAQGEPEAFDQVDGNIIFPLDGLPITNAQEYRDVLYIYKKTRTAAAVDNGDLPSTWTLTILDQGVGASVHGIATVLDSGGVNIDYILIADYSGILLFNGAYSRPELTWKIQDFWVALDRNEFVDFQLLNDSLNQRLYFNIPSLSMILFADYRWGLDPKNIKWGKWTFNIPPTTITLAETDVLLIGSSG